MKISTLLILTFLFISSCANKTDDAEPNSPSVDKMEKTTKQLRHAVLFKFKASATPADIQKVEDAFVALPSEIKEIKDFEWGLNNSPEDLNKGFTHCFLVTFDSEEGRAVYLPHPAHLAFVEVLSPHLEDVFVLDYWTQ